MQKLAAGCNGVGGQRLIVTVSDGLVEFKIKSSTTLFTEATIRFAGQTAIEEMRFVVASLLDCTYDRDSGLKEKSSDEAKEI